MVQVAESRDRSNREQHSSASGVWTCRSPYKDQYHFNISPVSFAQLEKKCLWDQLDRKTWHIDQLSRQNLDDELVGFNKTTSPTASVTWEDRGR